MYKCTATSGSGLSHNKGLWEMKETPNMRIFTRIRKGESYGFEGDKMKCKKDFCCSHVCIDWKDGTFTVYPNRCGIPFYFEPI